MAPVTRRALLGGVLGSTLVAGACARPPQGSTRSGTLTSRHWPAHEVKWQLSTPPGRTPAPVVVVLHGKGGDATHAFRILHLDQRASENGLGLVSVDGGDNYWHARRSGVDPGAMVVDDLLPLVRRETGYAGKVAFLGWSMGGYGSLLLASQLGPQRVAAVVAESAALWTDAGRSAPGAFDDREDFEAHDVFDPRRLAVLSRIPVRMDCGRSDPFVPGNTAFGRALPSARLTFDQGGHTSGYWRDHGSAQMRWLRAQFDRG